jgi:hypothetical protein
VTGSGNQEREYFQSGGTGLFRNDVPKFRSRQQQQVGGQFGSGVECRVAG